MNRNGWLAAAIDKNAMPLRISSSPNKRELLPHVVGSSNWQRHLHRESYNHSSSREAVLEPLFLPVPIFQGIYG